MSSFRVCPLLILIALHSANRLHSTMQFTHYQHVIVTLDVDKLTYGVTKEFKRTRALSKCIQNITQCAKNDKATVLCES